MVEMTVEYEGELRCTGQHGPSGTRVVTDAPVDNHGRGQSFSPTDLLATSLGACMLTIMGIRAAREGWDVAGTRARVVKHMVADPRRRVGRLEVSVSVPVELDASARDALREAALSCPVFESLHPAIDVPVHFEWGSAAPAP